MSDTLPSQSKVDAALDGEILDKDGVATTLRKVCDNKRTVVVFIRHFWCGNCVAYVSQLGQSIPPLNLPRNTQLIIIGCGSSPPIKAYIETTCSPYPIYANPDLTLYKSFGFKSTLSTGKPKNKDGGEGGEKAAGEAGEKSYLSGMGGSWSRLFKSLKDGPGRHLEHVASVGPKALNGGEVVFEADGTCSFIHIMQNPVDHIEIEELARVIGAQYTPISSKTKGGDKADTT
ncbi:hypothetical protein BCR39DRAFT_523642 [Naematelia encephala]|uniref:AhpC/TSA antioxidant enzyme-domain-containing protein n=1 Tax=Naematelia encephala TaxID=71784 RepID=A0A1Y2BBQ2_9TREE|nr:hypothetical protein BCR39DRAFT_523642 [Naematelia encephala]